MLYRLALLFIVLSLGLGAYYYSKLESPKPLKPVVINSLVTTPTPNPTPINKKVLINENQFYLQVGNQLKTALTK